MMGTKHPRWVFQTIPPMSPMFNRRLLRLVARFMLASWLLAAGIGVANACMVGGPEIDHAWAAAQLATQDSGRDARADDCDRADPGHAACQHLCDTGSLPPVKAKPLTTLDGAPLAPAPGATSAWPDPQFAAFVGPAPASPRPRPAVSIEFLRLTL